jgi:hypothetical protein
MLKTRTIAELKKELVAKGKQLLTLRTQRRQIAAKLAVLDKQIAALEGTAAKPVRKRRKKAKRVKKTRKVRANSLTSWILNVLAKEPKGMRAKDIAAAVVKAGYKTKSKNFYSIVAATLAKAPSVKRAGRGVYKLA